MLKISRSIHEGNRSLDSFENVCSIRETLICDLELVVCDFQFVKLVFLDWMVSWIHSEVGFWSLLSWLAKDAVDVDWSNFRPIVIVPGIDELQFLNLVISNTW